MKHHRSPLTILFAALAGPIFAVEDWGDAPPVYPTLAANNGARHTITSGFWLGTKATPPAHIDAEANGQPSAAADADDVTGVDDDDGVLFFANPAKGIIPWQIGAFTRVMVTVALPAGLDAAKLDAWVDFSRDGDFNDPGEQIFTGETVAEGTHMLAVFTPVNSSAGDTVARFRLSSAGGLGPGGPAADGEVEDYRISLTAPAMPSNVNAHTRDGQVWITWDFDPASPAQLYEIYRSPAPIANISQGQLVAMLYPGEYAAVNLVEEMERAYGAATANDHFTIPDAAGAPFTLNAGTGLCVDTVRATGAWHYAVVPHGVTAVAAGNRTAGAVPSVFSAANVPHPQAQQSGIVDGYAVTFYNLWVDGDDNAAAGLPQFPLMANSARRCTPHLFFIMEPQGGLPGDGPWPLSFALHSGDARAMMWLPGTPGFQNVGVGPHNGYVVAMEDKLYQMINGVPDADNTNWIGYVPTFNPFQNVTFYPGSSAPLIQYRPPPGSVIQPFTLNRLNWTLTWLTLNPALDIDVSRVSIFGHSGGGKGTYIWARTSPQRFSHAIIFAPEVAAEVNAGANIRMFGTTSVPDPADTVESPGTAFIPGDNFVVAGLTNRSGGPVRFEDLYRLETSVSPERDLPPMRCYWGLREPNWALDLDHTFKSDILQAMDIADTEGSGAILHWDLRQHGVNTWTLVDAGPPDCGFTPADFWIPNVSSQTRRDDPDATARYRNDESYPAFYNLRSRPGHQTPGTTDYGTPPAFFDELNPWTDPTPGDCYNVPLPVGVDPRGTRGGYFDWVNGLPVTDSRALRDTTNFWAGTFFLTKNADGAGHALAAVDECPEDFLTTDVAIRRPQSFQPATGTRVHWMSCDQSTRLVLQSGDTTVGADAVVRLPGVVVPKAPAAVRLVAATQLDFGDAPGPYPVTFSENGARHAADGNLFLGTGRNAETDGTHHATASSAPENDNGVSFPLQWPQNTVASLTITVNAPCRLDAWVDWARNNAWSGQPADARDQIAASLPLTTGENTLHVFVPPQAVPGATFARFRVSFGGCPGPDGPAPEGEVEDYPVLITAAPSWPDPNDLTVAKNPGGETVISWTGNAAWSWQIEHSADLAQWGWVDLPAAEVSGPMSVTIPASFMEGARHYFRIRRNPMVTAPVLCQPGAQNNLGFVHTSGSRTWDAAAGTWRTSSIARNYHVYVPAGWHPGRTWPLILMLHGHSMSGATLAGTQSQLRGIASDRGYITVFPDSTAGISDTLWFAYPDPATIDPADIQRYVDDKAFLFSLIDHLTNRTGLRVDATRIYCAGFSNGGSMTHFLSSDASHPFRAFAIMESGAQRQSFYEPRVAFDFDSGPLAPARPLPCILMNMVTSPEAWAYEGQPIEDSNGQPVDADNNGVPDRTASARQNVQRWLDGNSLTAPPVVVRHAFVNPGSVVADFPSYDNSSSRADAWWDESRRLLYQRTASLPEPYIPDYLRAPTGTLPVSWFQDPANWQILTSYPHLTFTQNHETYVVAGTWSEETWATPPGQSDREVVFLTLSDGGHQWPGASDRVGWDGQLGVMDFFARH